MSTTALITGGSHNIGKGIALLLAKRGYDVAITYRSRPQGAEEVKSEIEKLGRRCFAFHADLEKAEVPQQIVDAAYQALGHLDLVVCNAGNGGFRGSILNATPETVGEVYETNFRNYILTAAAGARYMVRDEIKGNIIFITSTRATRAYPDDYLYGGFKACVERACESIALDLSYYGIRVNCVAPGCTWCRNEAVPSAEDYPFLKYSIPMHRTGTAEDVGEAVAYLASDAASYITGTTLRVDGGLILPGTMEGVDPVFWYKTEWHNKTYSDAMQMVAEHDKELEAEA